MTEKTKMNKFIRLLIKHSQFKLQKQRTFYAGSYAEIPGQNMIYLDFGLNEDEVIDDDRMIFRTNGIALPCTQTVPEMFSGPVYRIYSVGLHAGYVQLRNEYDNTELQHRHVAILALGERHGPAVTFDTETRGRQVVRENPEISLDNWMYRRRNVIVRNDDVYAVHSPYWPLEASEWITRQRLNNSPAKSTIRKVARHGCDLVQVSHKLSSGDSEWRFSFSRAELSIIRKWTISQRVCHRTLHLLYKLMKNERDETLLCTYYFKTLMLWAVEEKPFEFWSDDGLTNSVCELLMQLSIRLRTGILPNYFIPSNNMIDHLSDSGLYVDIHMLYQESYSKENIDSVILASRRVESCENNESCYLETPLWLYTSLVVGEQIHNGEDNNVQIFSNRYSRLVQKALSCELKPIYCGVAFHLKSSKCIVDSLKESCKFKSIKDLKSYLISDESQLIMIHRCSGSASRDWLISWLINHETKALPYLFPTAEALKNSYSDNLKTHRKCLQYNRLMNDDCRPICIHHLTQAICNKNEVTAVFYRTSTINTITETQFYKEDSRKSPTVSISWFINQAYLANLYYATQNYTAAAMTCDTIIESYNLSTGNQEYAEYCLPVVLSTAWTTLYDEELQMVLGLYALSEFMLSKTDRSCSVRLDVCPVLFACYLNLRCANICQELLEERLKLVWAKYVEHFKVCNDDKNISSGALALFSALQCQEIATTNEY